MIMIESTELFFITSCWVQGWSGLFFQAVWGAPKYKRGIKIFTTQKAKLDFDGDREGNKV